MTLCIPTHADQFDNLITITITITITIQRLAAVPLVTSGSPVIMFSPVVLSDWGSNQPFMHILWYIKAKCKQIGSCHSHIHAAKFYKRAEFSVSS